MEVLKESLDLDELSCSTSDGMVADGKENIN